MMASSISNVGQVDYTSQAAARPQPAKAKPGAAAQDTVQISSAAKTALSAKPAEATETPAQTAQEAASGDPQALAKLAKEHSNLK
jgi:hypothetical protein